MIQGIFNASMEESMNLVTDKYIKVSSEDIAEKGYKKKILGFFTILFFMYLVWLFGKYVGTLKASFLLLKASWVTLFFLVLGLIPIILYFKDVLKIKDNRILAHYYFNNNMFLMVMLFTLEAYLVFAAAASTVLGILLSSVIYSGLLLFITIERYLWFKKKSLEALYGQKSFNNGLANFLDKFVVFAKKYGGLIILASFIIRWLLPVNPQDNDFFRSIGISLMPLLLTIPIYFSIALVAENLQGYYIQKYMEEYRQLSGYSIKEWYCEKSKKYKEEQGQ